MSQDLYDLPEGWEWVELREVCNLQNGFAFKASEYVEKSNTVIIRMGNIRPGGYFDAEHKIEYLPDSYAIDLKDYILNDGDLIIAMTDMASEIKILGVPTLVCNTNGRNFLLNQRVGRLYDFKLERVNVEYLRHVLSSNFVKDYYKKLGGGGLQINIGKSQILSVNIPLPPLTEQSRIVEKLDAVLSRIDTAIDELQQSLALVDAFYKSSLKAKTNDLEGKWTRYSLNELGCFSGGGTPSKSRSDYWDGKILWITPKDMKSWKLSDSEMKITDIGLKESSAKLLPKNSVLIVARSGILQHTLPVAINTVEATVNQDIKVFIPSDKIMAEYVQYMLKGHEAFILSQLVKGGVTVESLKYSEFQEHPFPVPDLQAQIQIVGELDALNDKTTQLKTELTAKIGMFNQLKASVLDGAFRGEV